MIEVLGVFVVSIFVAFAAIIVFIGGGLYLGGDTGASIGIFLAFIACALFGYFVMLAPVHVSDPRRLLRFLLRPAYPPRHGRADAISPALEGGRE